MHATEQDQISPQKKDLMSPTESLRRLAISETGFVFDPVSGNSFTINETGIEILRLLQTGLSFENILKRLELVFDTNKREMERDVLEFVGTIRDCVGVE